MHAFNFCTHLKIIVSRKISAKLPLSCIWWIFNVMCIFTENKIRYYHLTERERNLWHVQVRAVQNMNRVASEEVVESYQCFTWLQNRWQKVCSFVCSLSLSLSLSLSRKRRVGQRAVFEQGLGRLKLGRQVHTCVCVCVGLFTFSSGIIGLIGKVGLVTQQLKTCSL